MELFVEVLTKLALEEIIRALTKHPHVVSAAMAFVHRAAIVLLLGI